MPSEPIPIIVAGNLPPSDDSLSTLGSKAFNLAKLAALGFPIPPAFVLPTSWCGRWIAEGAPSLNAFRSLIAPALSRLEGASNLGFGDHSRPLLVSVRSGAPVSMPGMLNTVLNVGLTKDTLPGLVAMTGNPRLAWDCYGRLIESYALAVRSLEPAPFRDAVARMSAALGVKDRHEIDTLSLRALATQYLDIFKDLAGEPFPDDPAQQLLAAAHAVFRSWDSPRARTYRRINALDGLPGTAATVQRMVYGNAGPRSGAGVGFSRDPATGEKRLYLDFAFDAQGEDVVSGRYPVAAASDLARLLPAVSQSLERMSARLEQVFGDAQDFEFTVHEGELFLLQTREAKRTAWARLRIAVDLAREGLIPKEEALRRLDGLDLSSLVRRRVAQASEPAIAQGVPAGVGVVSGRIAFSVEAVRSERARGGAVIFVRNDIATEDIDAIASADGVLTARGGRTSHAAVVARELGTLAIVGCSAIKIANDGRSCEVNGRQLPEGAWLTLDGESGQVFAGRVEVREERPESELAQVAAWRSELIPSVA